MKDQQVNYHLSRLLSPVHMYNVDGTVVLVKHPTPYVKYLAEIIYSNTYDECIELFNENSILLHLFRTSTWSTDKDKELEKQKELLEDSKIQLFKSRYNKKACELIIKKLKEINEKITGLLLNRHKYDDLTAENVAKAAKDRFLIGASAYVNRKKYWKDPLNDYRKPDSIIDGVLDRQERLSETNIRYIARSNQFRPYLTCKFKFNPLKYDGDLIEIYQWATMYESIRKHPECPDDFVFENDDMVDGWVLMQRRQTEKDKLNKKGSELVQKHKGAGEIYVGSDVLPPEKVSQLNDEHAKQIIKNRSKAIQEKGMVSQLELPDVRQDIEMEMNKAQFRR